MLALTIRDNLILSRPDATDDDCRRVLEAVNEELIKAGARPYQGTVEVTHLLWFLATEEGLSLLEARGPKGLNGLKVAPYYGCIMNRPPGLMAFDDPENPTALDRVLTACGAAVMHDSEVNDPEFELLRAIADTLDCPIPPFVKIG